MLFDSLFSPTANNQDSLRKLEAAKRLDFYLDGQLEYLQAQLAKVFVDSTKITPVMINVCRKIIHALARVYIRPATRQLIGTTSKKDIEIYNEIQRTTSLDRKMKTAQRYTKLLNVVLLRPVWREKLDLDILTPDIFDVKTGDTPEQLEEVQVTSYSESGKNEDTTYSVWSADSYQLRDHNNRVISEKDNPYGVIPFVPCWSRTPTDKFFLSGGDDLIVAQEMINERITDLMYVLRLSGFGQAYIKGFDKPGQDIYLGPASVVQLPKDGELGFASTNAPIDAIIQAIQFLITQLALSYGLSASTLTNDPQAESGIAKVLGSQEIDEERLDDIDMFRSYEQNLFDMMRTVYNVHSQDKLSEKCTLKIDFYDPKPTISPVEQAQTWQVLVNLGLISLVDIALERNPDLQSREDALAFLMEVREEQGMIQPPEPIYERPLLGE